MNFKSWGIGGAVVASVVISFSGTAWYASRGGMKNPANEMPAVVSTTNDSVKTDNAYALPFAASGKDNQVTGVSGLWVGDVLVGRRSVQFTFKLKEKDGRLSGSAIFPIGEADIQDGKINGNQLSFTTHHRLASSEQKLETRYVGTIANNDIELAMSGGIDTNLTVKRIAY